MSLARTCLVLSTLMLVGTLATACSNDSRQVGWDIGDEFPADAAYVLQDASTSDISEVDTPPRCQGDPLSCGRLTRCGGRLPERWHLVEEDNYSHYYNLELGPTGCPHVLFTDSSSWGYNHDIYYARWDGEQWQRERVANSMSMRALDLAVDRRGRASVVYVDKDEGKVNYRLRGPDGEWGDSEVAIDFEEFDEYVSEVEHTIDPAGRPIFLMIERDGEYESPSLYYVEHTGEDWRRQEILSSDRRMVLGQAIEFDGDGHPHIGGASGTNLSEVFYARRKGDGSWRVDRLEARDGEGYDAGYNLGAVHRVGFALDTSARPHLVYCDDRRGDRQSVVHLRPDQPQWRFPVFSPTDRGANCGEMTATAPNHLHHIFGQERYDRDLRRPQWSELFYSHWNGQRWTTRPVGATKFLDQKKSLAADPYLGVVHIIATPHPSEVDTANIDARVPVYFQIPMDEPPSPAQ